MVLAIMRSLFYAATVIVVLLLAFRNKQGTKTRYRTLLMFPFLFILGAAAIVAYQATWQLAGFTRRDFIRFMERYNPRSDNAASHIVRGSILDRFGKVLAQTDPDANSFRYYPYGEATAHIIGFRHPTDGLTGMENAADTIVSGYYVKDQGNIRKTSVTALKDVRRVGNDVQLTLDADLQRFAYQLMNGRRGAVVGIDPRNGAIRILLSSPSFDPNHYNRRLNVDPASPLLNRAIHGRYPPGSTFKIAMAGLAVERGLSTYINCPADGYLAPGARRPIRDHEYYSYERRGMRWPGFGVIDLDTALSKSANSYFANAGVQCGTEAFNDLAERLCFNARIPIFEDESGAVSSQKGNIPHLGRGERRELSQLSIGQGRLTTTPLHLAMMVSAIANEGRMFQPRLIENDPPLELPRLFPPRAAKRVVQAMRYAVTSGTGVNADIPDLEVCGKTGTAQNPGGDDHAWFVCFAPRKNPTLALAVLLENSGFGSESALPVAVEILKQNFANEQLRAKEAK